MDQEAAAPEMAGAISRRNGSLPLMPQKRTVSPVKGIKPVRNRRGKIAYWYHRATGKPLTLDPNTAAGLLEIKGLDDEAKSKEPILLATLADVIREFQSGGDDGQGCAIWRNDFAENTRAMYRVDFRYLEEGADTIVLDAYDEDESRALVEQAKEARGVRAAQLMLDHLNKICDWAVEEKALLCQRNPFKAVPKPQWPKGKRRRKVNRALSSYEVIAIFDDAADAPGYQACLALMFLGGTRVGDGRAIKREQYVNGRLYGVTEKQAEEMGIAVGPYFRSILEAAIAAAPDCLTIASNAYGRPWTKSGFDGAWARRRTRLEKAKKIRAGATPHGFRHAIVAISRTALNASDFGGAAAINNRSEKTAAIYGRDAERIETGNRIRLRIEELLFGQLDGENVARMENTNGKQETEGVLAANEN